MHRDIKPDNIIFKNNDENDINCVIVGNKNNFYFFFYYFKYKLIKNDQ